MSIKTSPTIGLVLSGGGLKGAAHVGVLEAMQEFGLEATYISGASAGAIAGAFYAAGHSPDNLLKFFKDFSLFHFSRLTRRKAGFLDSEKFYKDLEKYFPTDSFEVLNKELYITATNLVEGTSKVFTSGELIRPILASAAFPGIFSPVIIGNEIYADGGILNNFPLEPVRGKCDLIIGVDVSPLKKPNIQDFKYAHRVMQRAYQLRARAHANSKLSECDILIQPHDLVKYGLFESSSLDEIRKIGYIEAKEQISKYLKKQQ